MTQPQNKTVGEKLKQAREQMGISLEDAARATHIHIKYLLELENDHPEMFISPVQARGFLRLYASFLNLPVKDLFEQLDQAEADKQVVSETTPTPTFDEAAISEEKKIKTEEGQNEVEQNEEASTPVRNASLPANLIEKIKGKAINIGQKITSSRLIKKISQRFAKTPQPKAVEEKTVERAPQPKEFSEDVFREIGNGLKNRREQMGLNLADVEHFTSIKRMYLIAMEEGRFTDLPSTVQGRGMLSNYAHFLAMDEEAVLDRFAQALQLQREERLPPVRRQIESPISVSVNVPENVKRVLNPDLVVGGALIIALFGFILWGALQILNSSESKPTEVPSISEVLQMTPTISPIADLTETDESPQPLEETPIPGMALVQSTPTPMATVSTAPLQLYIIAHDRAYLRINVDGIEEFVGRVAPQNVYTFSGYNEITLLTGNAAALEVYFNQEYVGKLGEVGKVVNLRFTPIGLSAATPQPSPTPTLFAVEAGEES